MTVRIANERHRLPLRMFALEGALAWWIYAVLEFLVLAICRPLLRSPISTIDPVSVAALLSVYPAVGALVSIAVNVPFFLLTRRYCNRTRWDEQCQMVVGAAATILFVHLLDTILLALDREDGVARFLSHGSIAIPIGLSALFTFIVAVIGSAGPSTASLICTRMNRWVCSATLVVLTGLIQVGMNDRSPTEKLAVVAGYLLIIAIVYCRMYEGACARQAQPAASFPQNVIWKVPSATIAVLAFALALRSEPRDTVPSNGRSEPTRPTVVLVTLDTVRADHLSLYGYARQTTPNLTEFAAGALVYQHAIAASDWTLASHASIFTGMYPERHHAHRSPDAPAGRPLQSTAVTLAAILRDAGYVTLAVGANHAYLDEAFGLGNGFQYYDVRPPTVFLANPPIVCARQLIHRVLRRFLTRRKLDVIFRDATQITAAAVAAVDRKRNGRPMFLFVNYMDAHDPYLPPPPYDRIYEGHEPSVSQVTLDTLTREVLSGQREIADWERRSLISQYDGAITYIDSQLGVLFARLRERGLYESSLIIVTSDHGEAFGERHLIGHNVSVYQNQVAIPLVIKYPASKNAEVRTDAVSQTDIMPTVLGVLGYRVPLGVQGRNLKAGTVTQVVFSESYPRPELAQFNSSHQGVQRAVISWPFKLVASTNGRRELFDLATDPDETTDRSADNQGMAKALEEALGQLQLDGSHQDPFKKIDPETLNRLRSLGYVR